VTPLFESETKRSFFLEGIKEETRHGRLSADQRSPGPGQ
jgi:hypothetical protein